MSTHSLTSEVSIGPRSHDLVMEELRIFRMLSSDTGSKEDRGSLLLLGLVAETGADDCSATLIFIILSVRKWQKLLGKALMEVRKVLQDKTLK